MKICVFHTAKEFKNMKKTMLIMVAALAGVSLFAQEARGLKGGPGGGAAKFDMPGLDLKTRIQLMKQFDKDGDGRLNDEERAEAMKALKDKTADLEQMRKKFAQEIIAKFDKDGDGKLGVDELMEFLEEQRRVFDAGRRNFRRGRDFVPPKEILAKFDKDGDGKLSREERRAMFDEARKKREALIKKYDADGDGKLNDAEKTKLIQDPEVQEMMKRMIGNPPPPPPPPGA